MTIQKKISPKLAKQKGNLGKAALTGKEVDEHLSLLESDLRKLKIEYEQYFGGGKSRPPSDTEWRIEQVIKQYGDRGAEMNYGQRFRYGNLSQAYAKYKEIFHKRLRKKEEGTVDRHYGSAARAIEAERSAARERQPQPASPAPLAVRFADPTSEPHKVAQIYKAFRKALEESGQPVDGLSPQAFEGFLRNKLEELRKQGGEEIEVVVSIEKNKPVLKARLKS
jgi:hypothetical protein